MTDLLPTIAAYLPPHLVSRVLENPGSQQPADISPVQYDAAVLFADISGFTPLTEALGQRGSEGPEELTRLLNRYFSWMIAFTEAEGGEVVKFGGDSLTVVFAATEEPIGVATRRAFQAAQTMQTAMDEFAIMESTAGLISLRMKIGIGVGALVGTSVGGISDRWEYIVAGEALFQATHAERQAKQGEIVLSTAAEALIDSGEIRPRKLAPPDWRVVTKPDVVADALRCYLPRSIRSWLGEGLHGWLATLRPMTVLFVGIEGLDYAQPDTTLRLHHLMRGVQEIVYRYEGSVPRLTIDDKGTVLLILFGAPPFAHEDDPERAVRCAVDLHKLAQRQNVEFAIGVTTGRVFAGPVGGQTRREYTVMGDTVNLAARLMVVAGPGQVRCNYDTYRGAYGGIDFEFLPTIKVKGKSEPIRVYRPSETDRSGQQPRLFAQVDLFLNVPGRQPDLNRLLGHLDTVQAGQSRIVVIEGEAGIGKTQLVGQLAQRANELQVVTLVGGGRSIEQSVPFHAWHSIFKAIVNNDLGDELPPDHPYSEAIRKIARDGPGLVDYLPLVGDGSDLSEVEGSGSALDQEKQVHQLVDILITLLEFRFGSQPVVLILEDAQWFDPQSWRLAVQLSSTIVQKNIPVLMVLVSRPLEDRMARLESSTMTKLEQAELIRLDTLSTEDTLSLVTAPLGLTSHELPEAVAELIRDRAGGNPYFAEEMFYHLHQTGFITFKTMEENTRCLVNGTIDRTTQILPATIQSTILARIDRLAPEKQLMLKVAAVIGQAFPYEALRDTLRDSLEITETELKTHLDDLTYLGFIRQETSDSVVTFVFKHIIIREVIYQSLLFDRRRQLHRAVARWYEEIYTPAGNNHLRPISTGSHLTVTRSLPPANTPLAPYFSLLVYHWHQAGDEDREQIYAALLGEQATREFANAEALGYLSRALDLTPENDLRGRYNLLLTREMIYSRRGDRERQAIDLKSLANLVEEAQNASWTANVYFRFAGYAEVTDNYDEAAAALETAVAYAKQAYDARTECKAYLLWARLLWLRGDLNVAQNLLEQALKLVKERQLDDLEANVFHQYAQLNRLQGRFVVAQQQAQLSLEMAQKHPDPLLVAHNFVILGKLFCERGQFREADDHFEQSVPIYFETGYQYDQFEPLIGIGAVRYWEGQYEAARDYFEQALDIARITSSQASIAVALSWLGDYFAVLGDYLTAQSYVGQALGICRELRTPLKEAKLLGQLARIYYGAGEPRTTKRYCQSSLAILQQINAPEIKSEVQTLLGHALTANNQNSGAARAYEAAILLRKELGQPHAEISPLVGLAAVRLAEGRKNEAVGLVEECLIRLSKHGTVGVESPILLYLKMYYIFNNTVSRERSYQVLKTAHVTLKHYADIFTDDALRYKFLNQVKAHRHLQKLWGGQEPIHSPSGTRSINQREVPK